MLLLFGLALSVIGMHHLPLSPHAPTEVHAVSTLVHLCLAVLYAAAGLLLLAWLLTAVGAGVPATRLPLRARRVWRPPGTAGRSLLTSLCVLRT